MTTKPFTPTQQWRIDNGWKNGTAAKAAGFNRDQRCDACAKFRFICEPAHGGEVRWLNRCTDLSMPGTCTTATTVAARCDLWQAKEH